MVLIENRYLRISILVDKGTDIIEFLYKPLDLDFMWRSPLDLRNPTHWVPTSARSDGAFLDLYGGGWQEILPRGGAPAKCANAEFGIHGEVSFVPWHIQVIEDGPQEVVVKFWFRTYQTPVYIEKTLRFREDSPVLCIDEQLTNEGTETLPVLWGHHPGFGQPLLSKDTSIQLPAKTVCVHDHLYYPKSRFQPGYWKEWPFAESTSGEKIDVSKVLEPSTNSVELIYATDFSDGWAALINQREKIGFGLSFSMEVFETE